MKKINRLFGLLMIILGFFVLASCSDSTIEAKMEYTASTNSITITTTFVESGIKAHIKQFSYDADGNEKNDGIDNTLSFSTSTTRAVTTFDSLDANTKYLFKLYVTEGSTDSYVSSLEARTKAETDDETPIEINSISDFKTMKDNPGANYKLMADLDFTGETFDYQFSESSPFEGTFDGNGKAITNVTLPTSTYMAIFNYAKGATIKNLTVENITADVSQKTYVGGLISYGEELTVSDVKINNVNIKASGAKSYVVYLGGAIAHSKSCNFTNVVVDGATIEFTRISRDLKVGLFAGYIEGDSLNTISLNNEDVAFVTNECSAKGSIKGLLWISSSDTAANLNVHVGGFVGHLESKSVVYNSFVEATIDLNKDTTSKTIPNYNLYAGGFVGLGNGNAFIKCCFANSDLALSSGAHVTDETSQEDIASYRNESLVKDSGVVYIGGFAGAFQRYIGLISDCYYKTLTKDIEIYAYNTRTATEDEKKDFVRENGEFDTIDSLTEDVIDGIKYTVLPSNYTTLEVTSATVDSQSFVADTYYYLEDNNYVLASEYNEELEYFTIVASTTDVKTQEAFDAGTFFEEVENGYNRTTTYKERELKVEYLLTNDLVAYMYETTATKLDNLSKYDGSDVSSHLQKFVLDYIATLSE